MKPIVGNNNVIEPFSCSLYCPLISAFSLTAVFSLDCLYAAFSVVTFFIWPLYTSIMDTI